MTAAPSPPAGAVADRPILADRGEIARWRHADRLPYLEVTLFAAHDDRPPTVTINTGPATCSLDGVSDPRELRQCAWTILAAAAWQERERRRLELDDDEPEDDACPDDPDGVHHVGCGCDHDSPDDPQTTIYDHLEATCPPST